MSPSALASEQPLRLFEAVEPHMGTLIRIKLFTPGQRQAQSAFRAAFDRIHQLDEILSDYKPNSELNTISATAVGHGVAVSDDVFRVLAASQQLAEESGGAFDITLGPVIRLWRTAREMHQWPDSTALQNAGRRCGYRKLHLSTIDRSVTLDQADMQLDVGGIAKGFAADEALAVVTRLGIHSALVAASGDLAFSDAPPGQSGWKIGLPLDRVLVLSNGAVSTSGDIEQHLDTNQDRYSHIIDPATNMGLTNGILVTVIAPARYRCGRLGNCRERSRPQTWAGIDPKTSGGHRPNRFFARWRPSVRSYKLRLTGVTNDMREI